MKKYLGEDEEMANFNFNRKSIQTRFGTNDPTEATLDKIISAKEEERPN